MFIAEIDRSHRLLKITFADHVAPEDARFCLDRFPVAAISSGIHALEEVRLKIQPWKRVSYGSHTIKHK
jgi:hypothetical protein